MTGLMKGLQPYNPTWKNHGTGGGTSFTLDVSSTTNATLLIVGGVIQLPGDYTVSGTTITTSTSVTSGVEVLSAVLYDLGSVTTPAAGSVNFDSLGFTSQAQGDILYRDSSTWARLPAGTSGQFLKTQGTGANPTWGAAGLTLSSETATTSGTAHTITGIPSGTKQINLMLEGVSLNGTGAALDTTIGDAGGLETSGYLGCDAKIDGSETVTTSTAAWEAHLATDSAAYLVDGIIQLTLKDATNFTWIASWNLSSSGSNTRISVGAGVKSLSAELTQVSLSGGTFDAGSIAVSYM